MSTGSLRAAAQVAHQQGATHSSHCQTIAYARRQGIAKQIPVVDVTNAWPSHKQGSDHRCTTHPPPCPLDLIVEARTLDHQRLSISPQRPLLAAHARAKALAARGPAEADDLLSAAEYDELLAAEE